MRKLISFFCILTCFYQASGEGLLRDYCTNHPELCVEHMCQYHVNKQFFDFPTIKENYSLIPGLPYGCNQLCDCTECHTPWWRIWAVGDDTAFYWTCRCKNAIEDDDGIWDENLDSWIFCDRDAVYPGYADRSYKTYSSLLGDHLAYVKQNRDCQCFWPETSNQAATISNVAYGLFYSLLESTNLSLLHQEPDEQHRFLETQGRFLNQHGLTIAFIANCFLFSHYECVLEDLEVYARGNFDDDSCRLVCDRLQHIRDILCPLFLRLYDTCLSQHSNQAIGRERDYLLSKLGYEAEFGSYYFADNGSLNIVFSRDDEVSDTVIAALCVIPEDFECSPKRLRPASNIESHPETLYRNLSPVRRYDLRVHSNFNLQRGIILSDQLRYAEAIAAFSEALKIDPMNVKVHIERAGAYWESNQIDLALNDYQQWKSQQSNPKGQHLAPLSLKQSDIECAAGLCVGISQGTSAAAIEYIPSTLRSLNGLGTGLWVFYQNPIAVSKEFIASLCDFVDFLRHDATPDMFLDVIPELRQLVDTWPTSTHYQRGEHLGIIIGKYGIEIFAGAGSLKIITKYRLLKNANTALTLESCRISEAQRKLVIAQAAQRQARRQHILKSAYLKIQWDKQNKHVVGSKNYKEGLSVVTHKDPQSLVNRFAGTGRAENNIHPGQSGYKEIVDFGETIGYAINRGSGTSTPTRFGKIHYAKDGVHIVPRFPSGS